MRKHDEVARAPASELGRAGFSYPIELCASGELRNLF